MPAAAALPSVKLSGPSALHAGDTFTVAFKCNGTGLLAAQGEILYNSSYVTYKSSGGVLSGWTSDIGAQTAGKVSFFIYDDKQTAPINREKQLFTVTFQVKSGAPKDTNIKITSANVILSDGKVDFTPAAAVYSANVAALSTNNYLSALSVQSAPLSPGFNKGVLKYTLSVPYSVSSLKITAKAEDKNASVKVSGNSLTAGKTNTVSVTVTSQSGAKRVYSIEVYREQDTAYSGTESTSAFADLTTESYYEDTTVSNESTATHSQSGATEKSGALVYNSFSDGTPLFNPITVVALCFIMILCFIAGMGAGIHIGRKNRQ